MGIFSFVSDAGDKLSGKTNDSAEKAEKLKNVIETSGFEVENFDAKFDDSTVTLTGVAKNNETREKVVVTAGNTFGVSSVDDQMELKEEDTNKSQMHTVVSGDSLGKIAKKYYNDASKYPQIFEANKPMLKNPDSIYVGQVLRIPEL